MEKALAGDWLKSFSDYVKCNKVSCRHHYKLNNVSYTQFVKIQYTGVDGLYPDHFFVESHISWVSWQHDAFIPKSSTYGFEKLPRLFNKDVDNAKSCPSSSPHLIGIFNYFADIKKQYIQNELVKILLLSIHEQSHEFCQIALQTGLCTNSWQNIELILLDEHILRTICRY